MSEMSRRAFIGAIPALLATQVVPKRMAALLESVPQSTLTLDALIRAKQILEAECYRQPSMILLTTSVRDRILARDA